MKRRIAEAWEGYRKNCIPQDAPAIQVKECRLAFFSGAAVLDELMMRGMSPGSGVTDADEQLVGDMMRELAEFGQELDREKLAVFLRRPKK